MRKCLHLITCILLTLLAACDVHEWPEMPEYARLHLRLDYETKMTKWLHLYDGDSVINQSFGETYENHCSYGKIRHIVRTYPISEKERTLQDYTQEFVITRDIVDGYDYEVTLDLLPGNYNIIVWSDLVASDEDDYYYNASDFTEITLQGTHQGNTNHRDAFHGKCNIELFRSNIFQHVDTIDITMKRPLAKFEIVANDLSDFIKSKAEDIDKCKVIIQYVGFMPDAFSLFTNKPVDATMGVMFESTLKELNAMEASMGFDYVFIGDKESVITIKIGVYNGDGQQIAMTNQIEVPIRPSYHTILTGGFLMQNASRGVNLNPDFDGNFNIFLPY